MWWSRREGRLIVVAHGDAQGRNEDFDRLVGQAYEALDQARGRPICVLIYAAGKGGPTTEQRHKIGDLDAVDIDMKVAVVTASPIVRGILTAVGWVFSQTPRAFAPSRVHDAALALGLSDDERRMADVLLAEVCLEGDLPPLPSLANNDALRF